MKSIRTAFAAALFLGVSLVQAAEFNQVQVDKSSISFAYQQMGVKMDGRFRKFAAQVAFDPARPGSAKATLDVELASVDTGSGEADEEVAGKSWFNTKSFPTAHFASSSVKPLGGNRYEVAGKLTIKGQARDIVIPVTLTPHGNAASFDGQFTIRRGDFAIGEGSWSKFDIVANDVQVKFSITAATGK